MEYGQFCPVAKAAEVLGEKWTILILRELLHGTSRFNEFQRAIPGISPTMLNKRLKELETRGLILKSGHDYRLTPAGEDLDPLVRQYAVWGMRWARGELNEAELDVEFLVSDMRRRIKPEFLPESGCIIQVRFTDLAEKSDWWLVVEEGKVSLKPPREWPNQNQPGVEPDLLVEGTLRSLTELWMGDITLHASLARRRLTLKGRPLLIRAIEQWLPLARYADVRPVPQASPARAAGRLRAQAG